MKTKKLIFGVLILIGILSVQKIKAQDYEGALRASIEFFDANRCGPDVASDNVFDWRGACHTSDGNVVGLDLTGGFHDAGDHVKFGLPQTWSAATMGFALYEFRQAFDEAGATTDMLSTLKHFTDFFLKCHINSNTFYYNVGDGNADHGYWGSPELQTGTRPVIAATPSTPASDVCGQASAALALMYLNYKNVNSSYATQCLNSAIQIFNLGRNNLGRSNDGGGGNFYKSTSHFDDLTWGAVWLYIATGDNSYLSNVETWIETPNDYGDDPYDKHWAPAWDDVTVFAMLKLYEITGEQKYYDGVINNLEWYRDECTRTPGGLPWLDSWGVLRYASAEAGVGYLVAQKFEYAGYLETADISMNYTLGSNPRNSSYITNWGSNPPQHPHHRANEPNRDGITNGMYGALVGGPNSSDGYQDNVNDYTMNEVAIDYNASFILGMAGKIYFEYNTPPKPNIPPVVSITSPSSGASFNQGETITISANASDSDGNVELVEFLIGGSKIGEDATSPYSISWDIPLAGGYTLSARAIDNKMGSTVSSEVSITAISNIPDPTTPNLALNKSASASSLENDGLPASNGVDGSYGSRWSSAFADPQWFQVDLGATYVINRAILNWEAAAGKVYNIQVSDNASSWQTVAAITGGNGGEDDIIFNDVSARYVRMYGTERTTPYGYSLFEFEIYGPEEGGNVPPSAVISASPLSGDQPLLVNFDGSGSSDSDGSIVSYAWNFGDGTSASGVSVSHTYATANSYSAVLTVTDNENASDQASVIIVVTEPNVCDGNQAPSISVSANPLSGDAPLTVTFDASGTSDPEGDALSYNWNFGDGSTGAGSVVQHTYTSVGNYNAAISVIDECGNEALASETIVITQPDNCDGNQAPTISMSANPIMGDASLTVTFDASGTSDPEGDALSFIWNFGDGSTGAGTIVQHTYTSAGSYNATLTVTDVCGYYDQASVSITVTQSGEEPCDNPVAVSLPYSFNGAGEYCWAISGDIPFINSWNMDLVEINGVNYTNIWSNNMPAKIDGNYYVHYIGQYPWSHFEAAGLKSAESIASATNKVSIYPNPFSNETSLFIEKPELVNRIDLIDITGKVVGQIEKSQIDYQIHLGSELMSGIYIVKVISEDRIETLTISKN